MNVREYSKSVQPCHEVPEDLDFPKLSGRQPLDVVLTGMRPAPATPIVSRAESLRRVGVCAEIFEQGGGWRQWRRSVGAADCILVACYGNSKSLVRRLAYAVVSGRPVVRYWVGSDVWNCVRDTATRAACLAMDRVVTLNIAGSPHLVEELSECGIKSTCIPASLDFDPYERTIQNEKQSDVLAYLPVDKHEFYGGPIIRKVVESYPETQFHIVGDKEGTLLTEYSNVINHGWLDDLEPVFEQVGCLLRPTQHDGLPRMMLEFLLRGKYVVSPWGYPGCWTAKSEDDYLQAVERFLAINGPNLEGAHQVRELLTPDPAERLRDAIASVPRPSINQRLRAAAILGKAVVRRRGQDH